MYSSSLFLTSAIDGSGWSTPLPTRFALPIVMEAGWAQVRSGRMRKILALTGIGSLDGVARIECMYRLHYSDPQEYEKL